MTKLILHFDINGTITPVDTTELGNNLENANMVISKSVYGKIINNKWIINKNHYNENDSISYYNYLRLNDGNYKQKSYAITNKGEPGEHLNYLIPLLLNSMETFLFPSFLNVLDAFPNARIIFRTFGLDADEVIEYLKQKHPNNFKTIIKGDYSYEGDKVLLTLDNGVCLRDMENINEYFHETYDCCHLALKESYDYWNKNNRNKLNGKQLMGNSEMVQIFFDDNDCVNIIDPINSHFVKINTLCALLDDQYYVNLVNNVLN